VSRRCLQFGHVEVEPAHRKGRVTAMRMPPYCTAKPGSLHCKVGDHSLLFSVYRHRLRAIVESASGWVSEKILGASEHISDDRRCCERVSDDGDLVQPVTDIVAGFQGHSNATQKD
jgi:hypothetical protein